MTEPLIFEMGEPGRQAVSLPESDVPAAGNALPEELRPSAELNLPEVTEPQLVRHYVRLSQKNHAIDTGFYPLGSCTMKYNPKVNEDMARLEGFSQLHPLQPEETVQGALELMANLEDYLCAVSGMDRVSLQPAAGAHGEFTGVMIIRAFHEHQGNDHKRKIIIPDSAHGTNPATVAMCGYEVLEVPSDERGGIDLSVLEEVVDEEVAGLMLTNPNTLGVYDENIDRIARIIHEAGGLLYYDGANANAIMGYSRPGDMGFDIVHFNLHKTFSTPHGGGGPGAGPVGVKEQLVEFLPAPVVDFDEQAGSYYLDYDRPKSIGRVRSFQGNFGVLVRAYTYIRALGAEGLKRVSQNAVLNANYLMSQLQQDFELPFDRLCKHEFVLSGSRQKKESGVTTLDMAKRLIDFGIHPPTIYFPLIVPEAMMIEPTESESKETLDFFIQTMKQIAGEAAESPEVVKEAPHSTELRRLDEAQAARHPNLAWTPGGEAASD